MQTVHLCIFLVIFFTNTLFSQNLKFKYALRDDKGNIAFFYTESQKMPKHIYHRKSTEKEKTKLELVGDYVIQADYDTYGQIKVRHPKTKEVFYLVIDEFLVRKTKNFIKKTGDEVGMEQGENYFTEISFELGKERLHAMMSPVGFSAFYYMPTPQTTSQKMEILNTEEAISGENPYMVEFPKQGKTTIDWKNGKLIVTHLKNKTEKVFLEKYVE